MKVSLWLSLLIFAWGLYAAVQAGFSATASGASQAGTATPFKLSLPSPPTSSTAGLHALVKPPRVTAGDELTVVAHGQPFAHMSIEVNDLSFTEMFKLLPKYADATGKAAWHFQVGKNYRADILPIIVTEEPGAGVQKAVLGARVQPESADAAPPLSFLSFPQSAQQGDRVRVTVKSEPGAKLRIEAQGAGFPQASALLDRTADADGQVTWTWQLPTNYAANVLPIIITADSRGTQAKIIGQINVQPAPPQPPIPQKENSLAPKK